MESAKWFLKHVHNTRLIFEYLGAYFHGFLHKTSKLGFISFYLLTRLHSTVANFLNNPLDNSFESLC